MGIDRKRIVERRDRPRVAMREHALADARNVAEAGVPIQERCDRDLVRSVERDRRGRIRAERFVREIDAGKAAPVGCLERERGQPGDVEGRDCILFDDIIDSGGTLCNAAEALMEKGAGSVRAYITHGVLSGGAVARITSSKIRELVITDSIEPTAAVLAAPNIRVIPIGTLIGEAIQRTAQEKSVSSLFD